ncbi:MAG: guanylate kinase [Patescibacteria group bacterium]
MQNLSVVSGPSGAGKGTLIKKFMKVVPGYRVSVSCTTRSPRPGETDGVEYHFIAREQFEEMAARGEFLEWAEVHGKLYGTPRSEVGRDNLRTIVDIDVQGARQIRGTGIPAKFIFVLTPDMDTIRGRIVARDLGVKPEDLSTRLENAPGEILDGVGLADFVILNRNGDLGLTRAFAHFQYAMMLP